MRSTTHVPGRRENGRDRAGMFRRRVVACARRSQPPRRREAVGAKTKSGERSERWRGDGRRQARLSNNNRIRALLEKSKTLSPPVGGDATAVKAYAAKKLAILKEVRSEMRRGTTRCGTTGAVVDSRAIDKPQAVQRRD